MGRPIRWGAYGAIGNSRDLRTGILLLLVFGIVRAVLVLQANVTGSYQVVSLVFVAMIALPWLLLTRDGRTPIRPSEAENTRRAVDSRWLCSLYSPRGINAAPREGPS